MKFAASLLGTLLFTVIWFPLPTRAEQPGYHPPTEYKSDSSGRLEVTLTVDWLESVNGTRLAPAYNGEPCGPTLRVSPGDVLVVTLENKIMVSDVDRALYDYVMDPSNVRNIVSFDTVEDAAPVLFPTISSLWTG